MNSELFTIITPSFNQGNFLEHCISSIRNQENVSVQHVVIDGASKDNSFEVLRKNNSYLDFWCHEQDNGQTDAINKGWVHARGAYVNWINADDSLVPGALKIIEKAFRESRAHVVCGFSRLIWPDGSTVIKRSSQPGQNFSKFIAQGHILQPSTFWKKEIFDRYFPLPVELNYMMDHFLWLQYISEFGCDKIHYIDDIVTEVKMHPGAKSVKQIQSFDRERSIIYNDLFASYTPYFAKVKLRKFQSKNVKISDSRSEIDFYLGYDRIFTRDQYGRRKRLRFKQLTKNLLNYPVKTVIEGVRNFMF